MDSNERNLFSQFERQPHVDLTQWRQELVDYTESRLVVAEIELRRYVGNRLTPEAHEIALNTVMSHLLRARLDQIEPIVQPGDRIRVKGNILYDIHTQAEHTLEPRWLEQGSELWGNVKTVAVKDYFDEDLIDADLDQLTEDFVAAHIRHFGTHLVLADPVELTPSGDSHGIPDCEYLLIPLMYRRLNLAGYLPWEK